VHASHVVRPDAGRQAELGVVRQRERFGFVLEWRDREDRTEDFVAHQEAVFRGLVHDRRLVEISVGKLGELRPAAAAQHGRALADGALHHRLVFLQLHLRRDRPHLRGELQRIAERDLSGAADEPIDERVVDALVDVGARTGDARLPRRREDAGQHAGFGLIQVRVAEHDVRALAAELEHAADQALPRARGDGAARADAAGERHLRHLRMIDQRSPVSRKPVTTLTTPAGCRPLRERASSIDEADVISDGLSTIVLPAASAGASDITAMKVGEFHGVITPTTPSGSRSV
jgi:hypothetical protein